MNIEKYNGEKYTFIKGGFVGHGGNGSVFNIEKLKPIDQTDNNDILLNKEYVVKFLKAKYNTKDNKRYKRFIKEIEIVKKCQNSIPGIMKIVDCNIAYNKKRAPYYVMRKGTIFLSKCNSLLIAEKINFLLNLAEILKKLHSFGTGYAHRDIKMDNIIVIEDKVYLSDFGLIWDNDDNDDITDPNEALGPAFIRPPELREDVDRHKGDIDYRKSDIYLFGKLVWSTLKNSRSAFSGEYNRIGSAYLDREKMQTYTMEPIHRLIERATKDNMEERLTIDECILLLKDQIEIFSESAQTISEKTYKYRTSETNQILLDQHKPSKIVYEKSHDIFNIIKEKTKNFYIEMSYQLNDYLSQKIYVYDVKLQKIKGNGQDVFILYIQKSDNIDELLGIAERLELHNNSKNEYEFELYISKSDSITSYYNDLAPLIGRPELLNIGKGDISKKKYINENMIFIFC